MRISSVAILGAACVLSLTATAVSADIVCNREGDYWHVRDYRPNLGLRFVPIIGDGLSTSTTTHGSHRPRQIGMLTIGPLRTSALNRL